MVKIAAQLERALAQRAETGVPGEAKPRVIAQGDGWAVADVLCTSGPQDRPFEEQHHNYAIAMVATGSFQYHRTGGCELMSPGSLVLGNAGDSFECGHQHGHGDRCLAFWYTPEYFERLAADAGAKKADFSVLRIPPLRELSSLTARAMAACHESALESESANHRAALRTAGNTAWEELGVELAIQVIRLAARLPQADNDFHPSAIARVTRTLRMIERRPDGSLTLGTLARLAGLSPCHFLRVFEQLTGLTPHQYILRARLRAAATRLALEPAKVLDIALDCGFGDVSNFNRAFRAEFGVNPRGFRNTLQ